MQKIRIDFDNPGLPQHISAVENDSQSRFFQATLYENGKAYTAPAGASYSIMYRGFGPQNQGWYDTINDSAGKRAACKVSGNVVTCEIARQALQVPGHVSIVLCVTTGKGYMLKSWPIECDCKNDRYDSTVEIQSFFYVTQVSNESWTQAIQAWEDLKSTIDPTLSVSGKAADAAKVGEAVNAEAERAKGVENQLKEDLAEDYTIINNLLDAVPPKTVDVDLLTDYDTGLISDSGVLINTTAYAHKRIEVKAGDIINAKVAGYVGAYKTAAISRANQDGTYTPLSITNIGNILEDHYYTADVECIIVITYSLANYRPNYLLDNSNVAITTPGGSKRLDDIDVHINSMQQKLDTIGNRHYVIFDGASIYIKSYYNSTEDVVIRITKGGLNGLPNIDKIYTTPKLGNLMTDSLAEKRVLLNRYTDWWSPHQVRAVNNADGSVPNTVIFTGGNHDTSTGGIKTAECTKLSILCDGVQLANGDGGFFDHVELYWCNDICGYNTWKSDNTGRKIMHEEIFVEISDSAKINTRVKHTALEDIERMRYYGLQTVVDLYDAGVRFVGGANRGLFAIDTNAESGNFTCREIEAMSTAGDIMVAHMSATDMGAFNNTTSAFNSSAIITPAKKTYFVVISNNGTAQTVFKQFDGESTYVDGFYDFKFVG